MTAYCLICEVGLLAPNAGRAPSADASCTKASARIRMHAQCQLQQSKAQTANSKTQSSAQPMPAQSSSSCSDNSKTCMSNFRYMGQYDSQSTPWPVAAQA